MTLPQRDPVSEIAARTAVESHEAEQLAAAVPEASPTARPESIFSRRLRKFRCIRRGYYSFAY